MNKKIEDIIEKIRVGEDKKFTANQTAEVIKSTIETLNTLLKNNVYLVEDMTRIHKNLKDMFNLKINRELEATMKLYDKSSKNLVAAVSEYIPAYLSILVIEPLAKEVKTNE